VAEVNASVVKALTILDRLGQAPRGLRLTDLAEQMGLPESTAHRLLASLAELGYVQQRPPADVYTLGWKIVTLARALDSQLRLVLDLRPYLERLLARVSHTVNLAVLQDTQVMYVESLVPARMMSLYTPPGALVPIHATSLGKALLSCLPPAELDALLPRLALDARTSHTITGRDELRAEIEATRRRGFALDRGEFVPDVNCVAAPIRDPAGRPLAALSVTARAVELPPAWEEEFGPLVRDAASAASHALFAAPASAAALS